MIKCILFPRSKLCVTSGGKINYLWIKKKFKKIETEEEAYWLGFLYADGCVNATNNQIELALYEKDYNHIVKFKNFMTIDNKISYREKAKAYRYSFKDTEIKANLIYLGCVPQKSLILKWPTEEQVPNQLIPAFLREYFDGDGWFSNTEHTFQIGIIGSEDFINGFLKYMDKIKLIDTKLKIQNVHREHGAKRYMFSNIQSVNNFLNFIYDNANIYLDRKYEHYQEYLQIGKKMNCRSY